VTEKADNIGFMSYSIDYVPSFQEYALWSHYKEDFDDNKF